ncbi:hypothetical protein LOC70_09510 [Rhodopirellula sp. JC737]|nr:hypothetical protein [Rhodopirellula sp. JC737]
MLWKPTTSTSNRVSMRRGALTLAATGSLALSLAFACVVTETIQLLLVLSSVSGATISVLNAVVATTLVIGISLFVFPLFARAFGVRVKHRYPAIARRKLQLSNLAVERRFLRASLIALAMFPLQTSLAHSVSLRASVREGLAPWLSPWWMFGLAVVALVAGGLIHWQMPHLYRQARFDSLLNGLRHYPRGVALRSFIAQWDNPSRNIYESCRVSRRIAWAYRSALLISAACFSAAGCLLARVELPWMLDELVTAISIAAVLALWPTAGRMVVWSGLVLDPICGDPDEFDEYE